MSDNVIPIRPLSEYKGVTMPKYGDGPIVFPNRDVLREYIAEQQASVVLELAQQIYNGAPDPCQAFYNYGLHPWLVEKADQIVKRWADD